MNEPTASGFDGKVWIAAVAEGGASPASPLYFEGVAAEAAESVREGDLFLIAPNFRTVESLSDWAIFEVRPVTGKKDGDAIYVGEQVLGPPISVDRVRAAASDVEALDTQAALSLVKPDEWAAIFTHFETDGWNGLEQYRPIVTPHRKFTIAELSADSATLGEEPAALRLVLEYSGNQVLYQPRIRLEGRARVVGFPKGAGEGSTGIELGDVLEVKTPFIASEQSFAAGDLQISTITLPDVLPSARYDISWTVYDDKHGELSEPYKASLELLPGDDVPVPEFKLAELETQAARSGVTSKLLAGELDLEGPGSGETIADLVAQQPQANAGQFAVPSADLPTGDMIKASNALDDVPEDADPVDVPAEPRPSAIGDSPLVDDYRRSQRPVQPAVQDTRVEQRIVLIRQEMASPPEDATLQITIDQTVTVMFEGKTYKSSLDLDQSALPNPEQAPQVYGEALFAAVFNADQTNAAEWPPTSHAYQTAIDSDHQELRVELIIDDAEFGRIQWEYMRDPRAGELALRKRSPLVRRVGDPKPTATTTPLKVLTAICSPAGMPEQMSQLDIPKWVAAATDAFESLEAAGLASNRVATSHDVDAEGNHVGLTHQRLNNLLDDDINVLHLVCHAGTIPGDDGKPAYQLAIDNAGDGSYFVDAESLQIPQSVQLVVLAACDGFDQRQAGPGAALGNRLIERGVPAVVSMQRRVHLDTALLFTERFYHDLARSGRVDMAVARTRRYLQNNPHNDKTDWGVPVLHLGKSDGRIMELADEAAAQLGDFLPTTSGSAVERPSDEIEALAAQAAAVDPSDPAQVAAFGREMASAVADAQNIAHGQDVHAIDSTIVDTVRLDPTELGEFIDSTTGIRLPARFCQQVTSALNIGKHIVLIGVPGTGKTTISQAICRYASEKQMSGPPVFATASADWTTFDTVGGYVPTANQTLAFREGVFLNAIGRAGWLALDEVNRADIDKAIGELFTVMAGQSVDLPFTVGGDHVRIVAPASDGLAGWRPDDATSCFHYVVHPNWRIVATMNVFDKASLFSMSNAFMRRLAFIDAGIPPKHMYTPLLERWNAKGADATAASEEAAVEMGALLLALLHEDDSWVMQHRQIGPAIAKDLIEFAYEQHRHGLSVNEAFAEALLLFVLPQFDGLSRGDAFDVCVGFEPFFGGDDAAIELVQRRLCDLYPAVADALADRAQEIGD